MQILKPFTGSRAAGFSRIFAIAVAQAGLAAGTAFVVRDVFNAVGTKPEDWHGALIGSVGLLVVIALLLAWLRRSERIEAEVLGQGYTHDVRLELYSRLGSLTPRDLQNGSQGGLLLRFIGDLTALRQWVSLGLARLIVASIVAIAALTALAFINPILAATVASVLAMGVGMTLARGKTLRSAVQQARRSRAKLAGDIAERISAMQVVQIFSQIKRERSRIARRSSDLRDAMVSRARVVGALRGIAEATTGLSLAAILAVGIHEVGQGRANPGVIVAAMSVLGLLTPAFRDLSRVYEYWHGYKVAMARIQAFCDTKPSVKPRSSAPDLPVTLGLIEFDRITYLDVLKRTSVTAQPGSKIAIVGPNGAGKSTLLSMVAQLIAPTSGKMRIDGHDIRGYSVASIRAAIGVVSPDLPLMRGTIGRNIRYRSPKASDEDVRRIGALCGIDSVLAKIPGGMEARVVEGGLNLSLGQRQRIALVRALLGGPSILLLDELDANLDPSSVSLIDRILDSHRGTVLFVSHRPEQIARADVIWHIADGSIIETGSPAELLIRDGPTRRLLWRSLKPAA